MADETSLSQAEYQDDWIELDGHRFLVDGPIRGTAISEFTTGIKIGAATYDEREHAFFLTLDDFTGGFGHRVLNVREALGTHYDNAGGVDLRRTKHITLPPKRITVDASADPTNITLFAFESSALASDRHDAAGFVYCGIGGAIYTLQYDTNTGMRTTLTRQFQMANTNRINRIVEFTGSDQKRGLYACGFSTGSFNNAYHRNTTGGDVTAWDKAVASGPGAGEFDTSGAVYFSDMIVWGDQLIGQTTSNEITSSADGAAWVIDQAVDNDPLFRARNSVKFLGTAIPPWGEGTAVYFIDSGKFYVLDFDAKTAYEIKDVGEQNFLLTGTSWNGNIFLTDGVNVWEYAPGLRETVRHLGPFGKDGAPPSWVEGAFAIIAFLPGTSHLFALTRSLIDGTGRLMVWQGTGWSWFGGLIPQMPYAATVDRLPVNISLNQPTRYIDVFATDGQNDANNVTAHTFKLPTTGDIPFVRNVGDPGSIAARTFFANGEKAFLTGWYDGGFSDIEGVLYKLKIDGFHMSNDNTVKVEYRLNNDEASDFTLLGTYVNNQQELWFDDEHLGIPFTTVQFKFTLNRKTVPNVDSTANANEAIDISETVITVTDGSQFAALDTITIDSEDMLIVSIATNDLTVVRGYNGSTAATHDNGTDIFDNFENPTATQMNASGTGPEGISDLLSRSPEIKTLILVFEKLPELRTAWTARVNLSAMKERGLKVGDDEDSIYGYWQFLKTLRNKKPLVTLFIPSLEKEINVRIADLPGTFNDFRQSTDGGTYGEGFVDLQLLEPVVED